MFNPKHLAVIRELINHPINEAALRWLEEVERLGLEADLGVRRQPMGPSPYDFHFMKRFDITPILEIYFQLYSAIDGCNS